MESATCFSKVKLLTGEEVLWNYLYIQISCFLSSFYFIHFNFIIMDLWFPILSMVYNLSKSVLFWYSNWTWFGPWETFESYFPASRWLRPITAPLPQAWRQHCSKGPWLQLWRMVAPEPPQWAELGLHICAYWTHSQIHADINVKCLYKHKIIFIAMILYLYWFILKHISLHQYCWVQFAGFALVFSPALFGSPFPAVRNQPPLSLV